MRQRKSFFYRRNNRSHHGTGSNGKGGVVGISRFGNDDFVSRIEAAHKSEINRFGTSGGNDYIFFGDINIKSMIISSQFCFQAFNTIAGAVFQYRTVDVSNRIQRHLRSFQIGLTDVEMIHFYSAGFGLIGKRN